MSEDQNDFGADTQMFRAFVERHPHADETSGSRWVWAAPAVVAVLVVVFALAWVVLG